MYHELVADNQVFFVDDGIDGYMRSCQATTVRARHDHVRNMKETFNGADVLDT